MDKKTHRRQPARVESLIMEAATYLSFNVQNELPYIQNSINAATAKEGRRDYKLISVFRYYHTYLFSALAEDAKREWKGTKGKKARYQFWEIES